MRQKHVLVKGFSPVGSTSPRGFLQPQTWPPPGFFSNSSSSSSHPISTSIWVSCFRLSASGAPSLLIPSTWSFTILCSSFLVLHSSLNKGKGLSYITWQHLYFCTSKARKWTEYWLLSCRKYKCLLVLQTQDPSLHLGERKEFSWSKRRRWWQCTIIERDLNVV